MNISRQNVWDESTAVLGRKFMALNIYIRKEEGSQTNILSFNIKILEESQIKLKAKWK